MADIKLDQFAFMISSSFLKKKILYCYLLSLYDLSHAFHGSGSFQIFHKGPAFVLDTHA